MTDFTQLLIGGVPFLGVIFGLVEFSKKLGLSGNWLTAFSLLLGLILGMAYRFAMDGIPGEFATWFAVVIFGLALGLITSGLYDFANQRFPRK
jgi:hypothetical protein